MKRTLRKTGFLIFAASLFSITAWAQPTVQSYSYTGSVQTFTVPSCVSTLSIEAWGAQGGANPSGTVTGGLGGYSRGVLSVTAGDVLHIYVGGQNGFNGGGAAGLSGGSSPCANAAGGVGGGASDIRLNGTTFTDRVIVAAGGGGAGGNRIAACGRGAGGGGGGGYYGGGGGAGWPGSVSGGTVASGGSQTAGGTGGTSTYNTINNGFPGSLGLGGNGGGETGSNQGSPSQTALGGGAGGGLTGQNGQHTFASSWWVGQSGAGGSSYTGTLSQVTTSTGVRSGHGIISFTFGVLGNVVNASATSQSICAGTTVTLTASNVPTFTWLPSNSNSHSISVTPMSTTAYTATGTNTNGCVSSTVMNIIVDPGLPVLSITSNTTTTCPGQTVVVTASGATTYTWTGGISNGVPFSPPNTNTYIVTGQNACGTSSAAITITSTPLPVFSVASPTSVCASKPATLTAGGAPNYTWVPGSNLTGNSVVVAPSVTTIYTVTGSDGVCAGFHTVEVQARPNPTINVTASNSVICEGDVVSLSANGADTYTWNPNIITGSSGTVAPSAPTLYQVSGTNSVGCISAASQVVLVNASPSMSVVASPGSICAGSSATLTAAGNGHSYLWSTSTQSSSIVVSPLVSTTYSVTGSFTTSNICTRTATVAVNVFQATLSVTPASPTICAGEELVLSAGQGTAYSWSTGANTQTISVTPSSATIYTVSATTLSNNISCVAQNSVFVDVHPAAQVNATASPTNICRGHTTTLTANGTSSYKWTGPMNSTQSSFTWSTNLATTYTFVVTGTDENGCEASDKVVISVGTCVGLDEQAGSAFNIYPNPNNGVFTVEGSQRTSLQLINELGQVIRTFELNADNNYRVNVSELSRGIYFLSTKNGSGHRIVVEN